MLDFETSILFLARPLEVVVSTFYDVDRNLMLAHVGSRRLSTIYCDIQDAVTIVQDIKDAEAASRKLIQEAYARGSSDNITCVVVRFENT